MEGQKNINCADFNLINFHIFQGFFRRTVRQKLVYKPCENPKGCLIMRISRNRCQYCRMQRCIMAGMSHEGKYAYSRPVGLDFNVNRFSYIPRVSVTSH